MNKGDVMRAGAHARVAHARIRATGENYDFCGVLLHVPQSFLVRKFLVRFV